jgi:enhancing lycopene biosynthesis protein 2
MDIIWTKHAKRKMRYYHLSESRLKRILNNPERKEIGITPDTIAVMQPAGSRHSSEIWVMYQKNKIITAWRYPGKSPIRGPVPIPKEILQELEENN